MRGKQYTPNQGLPCPAIFTIMNNAQQRLIGLTPEQLNDITDELHLPRFTVRQMAQWLYQNHAERIAEMTNLSKQARQQLSEHYTVGLMPPIASQQSADGTVKYLFPTESGQAVETVYIPDGDRATLCVSSQVGCKMNCLFCQTGKQGFEGQLTVADILNQIMALPQRDQLTNIVFMGQGEPMDNLDNVLQATRVLTAEWGMGWSPRRITVSSVGIRGKLERFVNESECHVAVSLHSPFPEERARLMPAERGMSLTEILRMLGKYDFAHQRRLSFEYILFGGLNDTLRHAKELVKLLKDLPCRVNLIRFHQIPDVPLHTTDEQTIVRFRDYLTQHGVFTTIRASRGQDIYAACGLLSTANKQQTNNT